MSSSAGAALANVSNTTRAGYKAGSKRATKPAADCLFHNPNTAQQQDTGLTEWVNFVIAPPVHEQAGGEDKSLRQMQEAREGELRHARFVRLMRRQVDRRSHTLHPARAPSGRLWI